MALEDPNFIRQEVRQILANTPHGAASTVAIDMFFRQWSQVNGGKPLQLVPFTSTQAVADGGTLLIEKPCRIHVVLYYKHSGSRTYFHVYNRMGDPPYDDAANQAYLMLTLRENDSAGVLAFPVGLQFGQGIAIGAKNGTGSEEESALADAPIGFFITSNV